MSKILVIPDVHGRKFWRKAIDLISTVDKVVFLGDYLDPYTGVTEEDALTEFQDIVKFQNKYVDEVILLVGNHDLPYLWPDIFPDMCRHCWTIHEEAINLYKNAEFELIYKDNKCLFSHAGVNDSWLQDCDYTLENLQDWDIDCTTLGMVGYYRGGSYATPSCVWADILEHDSDCLPYYQIFGHTQLVIDNGIIKDYFACLDCRNCFIVDTETKEITKC